jgi:phage tail-like protein
MTRKFHQLLMIMLFFPLLGHASFTIDYPALSSNPVSFSSVVGMSEAVQLIEYRHSNSNLFSTIKMPGIAKYGQVILRNAEVPAEDYWNFYKKLQMNTLSRSTIIIHGPENMTFTLKNAWPTKINASDPQKGATTITIESLSIAHEQLSIQGG